MILAGDVGGTKIHLAMFSREGGRLVKGRELILSTAAVPSLGDAVTTFCSAATAAPVAAGFGVAGPVVQGAARGSNLPWVVTTQELAWAIGGGSVRLANDLEASAHGLAEVRSDDVASLQAGESVADGNRGLVSPGTGLGECVVLHHEGRWLPAASEGGHADFAPRTDEEIDLLKWLRARYGRASAEHVVAGPGLVHVARWLMESGTPDDLGLADVEPGALPARITAMAVAGTSQLARETMRVWISVFGAEAGNVALRGLTVGGLFLGGGIPARILPLLREPWFLEAFRDKEPHRELLGRIPVHVLLGAETTLWGAARLAEDLART